MPVAHDVPAASLISSPVARTIRAGACDTATSLCAALEDRLDRDGLQPVFGLAFGTPAGLSALAPLLAFPRVAVEIQPCHPGAFSGIQVLAVPCGIPLHTLSGGGHPLLCVLDDGEATQAFVGATPPLVSPAGPGPQAEALLSLVHDLLRDVGLGIESLVRTWFYNRDLLDWYGDFNRVRTGFYGRRPFSNGFLPASTGISGGPADGSALTLGGWAFKPHRASSRAREALSPLQGPAPAYGSSFSRGAEVTHQGSRRLTVSGTASIDPQGRSTHLGDVRGQIRTTLDVVSALLAYNRHTWQGVDRALAYFRNPADLGILEAELRARGLEQMPFLPMGAPICRHDLLFELEVDARA